jgi:REP element-mobilizing transposase RayT
MARPLRIEYPFAVYHITSRGNRKNNIFNDDNDRKIFLEILEDVVKKFNWLCHVYCLMNNHYHLVTETPEANLSEGMRHLNGVYTQTFNKIHDKVGHLFQGRYKAILVDKESYLLELCRYVILNPIRAGIVDSPYEWKWSSFLSTAGIDKIPNYLSVNWLLDQFNNNRSVAEKQYSEFILSGIKKESPWEDIKGQIFLGSKEFIENIGEISDRQSGIKEIPRVQRYVNRPNLAELFGGMKAETKSMRNEVIPEAYYKFGYKIVEIANFLNIHYTTVSKVIKTFESKN